MALILGFVLTKLSFGADFERLERKIDFLFFSTSTDANTITQYELLHESAFQAKRPEQFDTEIAKVQRARSAAFSLVDAVSPVVMLVLTGHYVWRLIAG